jgi:hypothetical protein
MARVILKRAIERLLVHPLSNLIATAQITTGDWIELDLDDEEQKLSFARVGEGCISGAEDESDCWYLDKWSSCDRHSSMFFQRF